MNNGPGEFKPSAEFSTQPSLEEFVDLLKEWQNHPWNDDIGIASFSDAMLRIIPENLEGVRESLNGMDPGLLDEPDDTLKQDFLAVVARYLEDQNNIFSIDYITAADTSYKGRKLYHSVRFVIEIVQRLQEKKATKRQQNQNDLIRRMLFMPGAQIPQLSYKYPDDYVHPEAFVDAFRAIEESPALTAVLVHALERFRIRTTLVSRYLIPAIEISNEFADRPVKVLSVGVGSGEGEQALISNTPFDDVEIMSPFSSSDVDHDLTDQVNARKNRGLNISELIGFDLLGIKDPVQNLYIRSSLLLNEHLNKKYMKKYDKVAEVQDERLSFHMLDMTDDGSVDTFIERYQREHGEPPAFDVGLIITMLYQLKSKADREAVMRNISKFIKPNGFVLIQDSIDGSFEGDYKYVTVKVYPHRPKVAPEIIAISKNDRCHQIVLNPVFDLINRTD